MKFMITWVIPPENLKAVLKRFEDPEPSYPSLKHLGRWHGIGTAGGFRLVETDDLVALGKFTLYWQDLMNIKVDPVNDDEAIAKVLGG